MLKTAALIVFSLMLAAPVFGQYRAALAAGQVPPEDMLRVRNLTGLGSRAVVKTPVFNTTAERGVRPLQDWHVITLQYDVLAPWIDELTVQYFLMAMTRDAETGGNAYSLFRKTVRYVDIEQGRNRLGRVFLRPAGLKRFGRVVACAAVISIGGQVVDAPNEAAVDLPENWWENPLVLDNPLLTIRDGYLLDRSESPWAMINYDDYEFIQ